MVRWNGVHFIGHSLLFQLYLAFAINFGTLRSQTYQNSVLILPLVVKHLVVFLAWTYKELVTLSPLDNSLDRVGTQSPAYIGSQVR